MKFGLLKLLKRLKLLKLPKLLGGLDSKVIPNILSLAHYEIRPDTTFEHENYIIDPQKPTQMARRHRIRISTHTRIG